MESKGYLLAVYIRVSTDSQDTERQYASARHFLGKNELSVRQEFWFEDFGYARDETDRPAFQRMLRAVEDGQVQWILVDQQDRFGTKTKKQFLHFLYVLEEAQCRLITVEGKDLTADDLGSLFQAMLESDRATQEPRTKSWRVLGGLVKLAKRGIHVGGLPPFGFDIAVYASENDNAEQWRVIYEGKHKRLKVFPDGRTERFDGEGNFPPLQIGQVRRLAPTKDQRKLEVVLLMFRMYATQVVSFNRLAGVLNSYGYRAGGGRLFNATHVQAMLCQTAYIGYPAWNRRHVGKFHVWRDGETKKTDFKGKRYQANERSDWVVAERQLYNPLVEVEVWEAVQSKLGSRKPKQRAARCSDFLLSGLLICGRCGRPMAGSKRKRRDGKYQHEYFCSTYHQHVSGGRKYECACLRHTVKQVEILNLLRTYCGDLKDQLEAIEVARRTGNLAFLEPYWRRQADTWESCIDVTAQMERAILNQGGEITLNPGEGSVVRQIQRTYERLLTTDESQLRERLRALQSEYDELTDRILALPAELKRARRKAEQRLLTLEGELDQYERRLANLSERADELRLLFDAASRAVVAAQQSLEAVAESDIHREQAAAIRSIVQQVELTFAPISELDARKTGQIRKRTVKLVQAKIVSALGEELIVDRGCSESTVALTATPGRRTNIWG